MKKPTLSSVGLVDSTEVSAVDTPSAVAELATVAVDTTGRQSRQTPEVTTGRHRTPKSAAEDAKVTKLRNYAGGLRDLFIVLFTFSVLMATLHLEGSVGQLHAAHSSLVVAINWGEASSVSSFDDAFGWLENAGLNIMDPTYAEITKACPVQAPDFGSPPNILPCNDKLGLLDRTEDREQPITLHGFYHLKKFGVLLGRGAMTSNGGSKSASTVMEDHNDPMLDKKLVHLCGTVPVALTEDEDNDSPTYMCGQHSCYHFAVVNNMPCDMPWHETCPASTAPPAGFDANSTLHDLCPQYCSSGHGHGSEKSLPTCRYCVIGDGIEGQTNTLGWHGLRFELIAEHAFELRNR
jgi:hypothetical protein